MKRLRLEVKEISAEGYFEGLLSPYNNIDLGGDVVEPGAYTKTLKDQGNKRPLLWQHKADVPIGDLTLEDRPEGLWAKGQLLMSLPEAQKAYLLLKAQIVKGLSIGFDTVKDSIANGVRRLKEIKLYEGSIVTFPMNEAALITSVKARENKGDFNEELTEIQLSDMRYQISSALSCALSSCLWSSLTREQKISAAETIIEQFHEAYMAFLPSYLDMLAAEYGGMETWSAKRFETKAGRRHSAATLESIKSACDHMKSGQDLLLALLQDEADEVTSGDEAASKSEPVDSHSAAILSSIRALIPAL